MNGEECENIMEVAEGPSICLDDLEAGRTDETQVRDISQSAEQERRQEERENNEPLDMA